MNGFYWIRVPAGVLAALFLIPSGRAQTGEGTVVQRGADYAVHQTAAVVQGTNRVRQYIELATGLNRPNRSGQWVPAQEQISLLPQGGAVAAQGRHAVYFPADIYNGVLTVITPDGRELRSRPLGVSYDDGRRSVFIATLTNSIGWLTASNQVTYRNCFAGLPADLVCTYRKSGFECDLVFRTRPPAPDVYGLDPEFSALQLVTEFFNTQDPQPIPGAGDEWFGLQDSTLKFGQLTMTHGKAFAFNGTNGNSRLVSPNPPIPVYKSWVHAQGRTFLIESVPRLDLAEALDALPLTAQAAGDRRNAATLLAAAPDPTPHGARPKLFPPGHDLRADTNRILLATGDFKREPGVVLDYNTVDDSRLDLTFHANTTYYLY